MIQVQGHGEVEAAADLAIINLGVVSREAEARAAMQATAGKMNAILAAVKAQGVPDRDIQTTQLTLHLDQQNNVYLASNHITVRCEDVSKAGAILDAAVEAGANATAGIVFGIADQTELESRALQLAVADARRKAETLAQALGVTVGGVDSVSTSSPGMVHPVRVMRSAVAKEPAPVEPGQLQIAADVQVTYRIQ